MLVGITTENTLMNMQQNAGSTSCAKPTTPKPAHNEGRWTDAEHGLFLDGLRRYGRQWFNVGKVVKTRSVTQIRTHAQKYFAKQEKEVNSMLQTITTKAKTPRRRADASEAPVVSPLAKRHGSLHHKMAHKTMDGLHVVLLAVEAASSPDFGDRRHVLQSFLKQPMTSVVSAKIKHLIDDVAAFVRRREKASDALHLGDMHIAIDSGAYMTVESAVTALLVRLKTLKSTATATLAQQLVLQELPQLFISNARSLRPSVPSSPPSVTIPVLNPQPSPMALKLPRLADWAPSSSSPSACGNAQCIAI